MKAGPKISVSELHSLVVVVFSKSPVKCQFHNNKRLESVVRHELFLRGSYIYIYGILQTPLSRATFVYLIYKSEQLRIKGGLRVKAQQWQLGGAGIWTHDILTTELENQNTLNK